MTGTLRNELGFTGVIATDDMSMGAIAASTSLEDAAVAAIAAGCDLVLVCNDDIESKVRVVEAVVRAVERDDLPAARVDDALARHHQVKARFLSGAGQRRPFSASRLREVLSCDEHNGVADEMRRYA